jgi:hypothetical protein
MGPRSVTAAHRCGASAPRGTRKTRRPARDSRRPARDSPSCALDEGGPLLARPGVILKGGPKLKPAKPACRRRPT